MAGRRRGKGQSLFDIPEVSLELMDSVEEASRFFVDLRGVGHFLAPEDSRILLGWLGGDVPIGVVLKGINAGGKRLFADGRPVRNLRSIKKDIQKEVNAYRRFQLSARNSGQKVAAKAKATAVSEGYTVALRGLICKHQTELDALVKDAKADGLKTWIDVCTRAKNELDTLWEPSFKVEAAPSAVEAVPAFVAIGRRFYDDIRLVLDPEDEQALRREAEAALEGWIRPMSESAREETIQEMMLQSLRRSLALFDAQTLYGLWDL